MSSLEAFIVVVFAGYAASWVLWQRRARSDRESWQAVLELLERGELAQAADRAREAMRRIRKREGATGYYPHFALQRARAEQARGRLEEAWPSVEEAVRFLTPHDPWRIEALQLYAVIALDAGYLDEAYDQLWGALRPDGSERALLPHEEANLRLYLGEVERRRGRLEAAADAFREALARMDDAPEAVRVDAGPYRSAPEEGPPPRPPSPVDPARASALLRLAEIAHRMGDRAAAREAEARALALPCLAPGRASEEDVRHLAWVVGEIGRGAGGALRARLEEIVDALGDVDAPAAIGEALVGARLWSRAAPFLRAAFEDASIEGRVSRESALFSLVETCAIEALRCGDPSTCESLLALVDDGSVRARLLALDVAAVRGPVEDARGRLDALRLEVEGEDGVTVDQVAAFVHRALGEEAEELRALGRLGALSAETEHGRRVRAWALVVLACRRFEAGDDEGARAAADEALSACDGLVASDVGLPVARALLDAVDGRADEAERGLRDELAAMVARQGERGLDVIELRLLSAVVLRRAGRVEEARDEQERAIEVARLVYGDEHPYVAHLGAA